MQKLTVVARILVVGFNFYVVAINVRGLTAQAPAHGPDYRFLVPDWLHTTCAITAAALCVLALGLITKRTKKRSFNQLDEVILTDRFVEREVIPLWVVVVLSFGNFVLPMIRLLVV